MTFCRHIPLWIRAIAILKFSKPSLNRLRKLPWHQELCTIASLDSLNRSYTTFSGTKRLSSWTLVLRQVKVQWSLPEDGVTRSKKFLMIQPPFCLLKEIFGAEPLPLVLAQMTQTDIETLGHSKDWTLNLSTTDALTP